MSMDFNASAKGAPLRRQGFLLDYATLGWNIVGVALAAIAAVRADSVALAGFSLDSLIEIFASVIVIWQLMGGHEHHEKLALRLIACSFIALATYIFAQTISLAFQAVHPQPSTLGLYWLAATLIAMLLLATGKRVVGTQLGNAVLRREARVTLIDAILAASVFLGLALNAALGWWWADPAVGLVIGYYALREARDAWGEAVVSDNA